MRDITEPYGLCSIDPITLGIGALGALGGTLFGSSGSGAPTSAPQAPPPQAAPTKSPAPKANTQQPTFMGGIPTPPPVTGQKTLLGQ